ncbi:component of the Tol biopolymer transport system [Micromonospora pattaloongensis]|uniref:Component of the Tol biopolymer transport system n=1 Tax=Micromonospora pattaloongensis TaxID=405436 RepID=A0A1H3R6Z5_9ACTN|nr:component of the Tol biopolymer transport system [Micromonospora pattaloongensis]
MRWGSRRWGVVVLGLLAGPALAAPEPPGPPPAPPTPPAAAADYRLGYTSPERPTLMVARGGTGTPQPLLSEAERGAAEQDADGRAGQLVWVGRRAAGGGADLTGGLYLRQPGAAPRRLVGAPGTVTHPALSPDGRRVAFTSDRAGNADVWVVGTDGTGLRRLTDHPAEDTWPTWSPDGARIAYASTRDDLAGDLWIVPSAGGAPVRLTDGPAADGQPAWSPDGRRIAFTTDRFAPGSAPGLRTVATVAPTGGPVTRAVPGPGDATEPAWSADGARLAFTTTRDDPAGDVQLLRDGRTVPVATGPLPQHEPAWRGADLLWTDTDEDASTDVWSADATGADRRDHTARPELSEHGPAFSPDGTRLAYSAEQPDGGARIVVADATGANPQVLAPPGTAGGDRDTDPTWSPAGDAIAFSRQPADGDEPSRIVAASVADARLLAEVPMPAYLTGRDSEPSWSPDGRQLAFARDARPRDSDLETPVVDRPARPGSTFTVTQSVRTPEIPPRPDIVFLVDDTASMSQPGEGGASVIGQLKARLPEVIRNVRSSRPDARFGLATFSGVDGEGGYDEHMYFPRQAVTDDEAAVYRAVDALTAQNPYGVENWFYALRQLARNDRIGFRPDGSRVVVLISDTDSVDKSVPPPEEGVIAEADLTRELQAAGIALIGVPIVGADFERGLNYDGAAGRMTAATGGRLTGDSDPGQMIDAVQQAIRDLTVTVRPAATCDDGLSVGFDPDPARVPAGDPAVFRENVTVAPGASPGTVLHCTVRFDLDPPEAGADAVQDLTVRIARPDVPLVRVDDVRATATGVDGARVNYTASAVDSADRPLPVRCQPPSGSLFPIGQTVVTCTATDGGGRTGSDTALIVVADPTARGSRIWLARLDGSVTGTLTVTDQRDLSARVGPACPSRSVDRAPAWSPNGAAIAFADSGGDVCVVAPDGAAARHPLSTADRAGRRADDPAWSPDGRRLAVALSRTEDPELRSAGAADIVVLPSAGGPATTVIREVGYQPAFQRLPVPDISLTVSVAGQPGYVGGDPVTVTFTVRNATRLPADNVWLDVAPPTPLLPLTSPDSRCDAGLRRCLFGTLGPGGQQVVTVVLPARAAVAAPVTGRLSATVRQVAATRTAQASVRVLAPRVRLDPAIGPPGFVTAAVGADFPPGARVRLRWSPGITTVPDTAVVGPDGSFRAQVLVLRKDTLGPRDLTAGPVTGPAFGPVRAPVPFLVVPRELGPPVFSGRG